MRTALVEAIDQSVRENEISVANKGIGETPRAICSGSYKLRRKPVSWHNRLQTYYKATVFITVYRRLSSAFLRELIRTVLQ